MYLRIGYKYLPSAEFPTRTISAGLFRKMEGNVPFSSSMFEAAFALVIKSTDIDQKEGVEGMSGVTRTNSECKAHDDLGEDELVLL